MGIVDYRSKFKLGKEPLNYPYSDKSKSLDQTSKEIHNENGNNLLNKNIFIVIRVIIIITLLYIIGNKLKTIQILLIAILVFIFIFLESINDFVLNDVLLYPRNMVL